MNTKLLKATIGLTIVMLLVSACGLMPTFGSRNLISETRAVNGYNRVDVSGGGTIGHHPGRDRSAHRRNGRQHDAVRHFRGARRDALPGAGFRRALDLPSALNFTLHVKDLSGITTSGSWDVTSAAIKTVDLAIVMSGSGKVKMDSLTLTTLSITSQRFRQLYLAGKTDSQTISISGSGKYLAGDLSSQHASVTISGSGNVTVWATDTLTVHVSGSGDVSYYGSPQVSFDQCGSGNIHNLGSK